MNHELGKLSNYELGKFYKIRPFGPNDSYNAECVGFIRVDKIDRYPVFRFDFYKFNNPLCYMALVSETVCLCHGGTVDEMMERFQLLVDYRGTGHETIKHAGQKIPKAEFVQQARDAGMSHQALDEAVSTGKFNGCQDITSRGGEIKWCPTCKKIRHTSCSACGCGNCSTCQHRWSCMPCMPFRPVGDGIVWNFGNRPPLNLV